MLVITFGSVLMVPVIAVGSVVLISKVGGKTASKKIRYLHGVDDGDQQEDGQQ